MAEGGEDLRLFVALPVPAAVKRELERQQQELRGALSRSSLSWSRVEQFHLTLKFLGNVASEKVPELQRQLELTARKTPAFGIEAASLGAFPSPRRPRVLWAGLKEPTGVLAALQQEVEEAAGPFSGQPAEQRFHAHLTLARVKFLHHREAGPLENLLTESAGKVFGKWVAEEMELVRSRLGAGGASHEVLARLHFGGASKGSPLSI